MTQIQTRRLFAGLMMLLSVVAATNGRFTPEQIDELGKACNASEEDLAIAKAYKVPTTETGKCLIKCMISKLGLLNADGSYNKIGTAAALKQYWTEWSHDKIELINDKCYAEASTAAPDVIPTCNYAYSVMACINLEAKNLGILQSS
ncbi:uncharacterized protein LOC126846940 [Adelges cooleyi]|uniref:uncharacterized protein LOC126846940 n=1 Tax=Adelges cooleyi TaxID=133065 RepID=UPI00217F57D7|nr:uncharacterized protein LOC126846940 [Adelges cooleyi]